MYGKKNKNKNKNYYRKSVNLSLWLRSVGIYDKCVPFGPNKKCHVTDYNVTLEDNLRLPAREANQYSKKSNFFTIHIQI